MKKRRKTTLPTTTRGYVGLWRDGSVGWFMCEFVSANARMPSGRLRYPAEPPRRDPNASGETAVLCEITVRPVRRKDGRLVTRRFQEPRP